jgi:hypothetical protein
MLRADVPPAHELRCPTTAEREQFERGEAGEAGEID